MHGKYQLQNEILNQILTEESAVLKSNGEILAAKSKIGLSLSTLPVALTNILKYFPLNSGDVIVLNDPFSGGSCLNDLVFITPLHVSDIKLYFATSKKLTNKYSPANQFQDEGVRIPPTPIQMNFERNDGIIEAISSSFKNEKTIREKVINTLDEIQQTLNYWRVITKTFSMEWNNLQIQNYLKQSENIMLRKLQELPHDETSCDIKFDTGEIVKVSISVESDRINLNYAGTSQGNKIFFPEGVTLGITQKSILDCLKIPVLNSGITSCIHISKPASSMLNAKSPSPTIKSTQSSSYVLYQLISNCLTTIINQQPRKKKSTVPNSPSPHKNIIFPKLKKYPTIQKQTVTSADAYETWVIPFEVTDLDTFSVQAIESKYGITFKNAQDFLN